MKKILISILIFVLLLSTIAFVGCDNDLVEKNGWNKYTKGEFGIKNSKNPLVEITFSTGDSVRLELYPDEAPITVENFVNLAKSGVYNGLTMHRIIYGFMIQGGGFEYKDGFIQVPDIPETKEIKGEFKNNGVNNNVSHLKGVISMARSNNPNSATTQFFICSANATYLDGDYAGFGRVIDEESMQAVVKISRVETGEAYINYGGYFVKSSDVPNEIIDIVRIDVYNA